MCPGWQDYRPRQARPANCLLDPLVGGCNEIDQLPVPEAGPPCSGISVRTTRRSCGGLRTAQPWDLAAAGGDWLRRRGQAPAVEPDHPGHQAPGSVRASEVRRRGGANSGTSAWTNSRPLTSTGSCSHRNRRSRRPPCGPQSVRSRPPWSREFILGSPTSLGGGAASPWRY